MAELGAIRLRNFIRDDIGVDCQTMFHVDVTHLTNPNLPFDIYVYKTTTPFQGNPAEHKAIYLSEGQLNHEFRKISARIKVLAGHAKIIFARQTVVSRLDKKVALEFLKEHHLQVPIPGKYRYGLYEHGELVSIASFSGARRMLKKGANYRSFELLRFCHKSDSLVVGGLSKLLKRFILEFKPDDIMTYVDRDWSQHSSLSTLGFQAVGENPGSLFWISGERQFQAASKPELESLRRSHPNGYHIDSAGSTKLLKYLSNQL